MCCFTAYRYGWRFQIGPWVREGYRVVAPDMLGYGGTDKPQDPSDYSTQRLCADLAALLDLLGVQRAVCPPWPAVGLFIHHFSGCHWSRLGCFHCSPFRLVAP